MVVAIYHYGSYRPVASYLAGVILLTVVSVSLFVPVGIYLQAELNYLDPEAEEASQFRGAN